MTTSTISAADAGGGGLVTTAGNDGTLTLQAGPAGGKVNAVVFAADGTPTQIKGTTLGSAPTPVPSGSAPLYGVRAWCKFAGATTGTNAPTAGGNVTSVTRTALGGWTINFTTAMPDTDYAVVMSFNGVNGNSNFLYENSSISRTTTSVSICAASSGSAFDPAIVSFMLIR